jgi:hypothetical protein
MDAVSPYGFEEGPIGDDRRHRGVYRISWQGVRLVLAAFDQPDGSCVPDALRAYQPSIQSAMSFQIGSAEGLGGKRREQA